MLKRALILLTLALTQAGLTSTMGRTCMGRTCLPSSPGTWRRFQAGAREARVSQDRRSPSWKRSYCLLGHRLKAEIEVRYADDGTLVYKGPIVTYFGFLNLLPSYLSDRFMLNLSGQDGIHLGLNGMAVGGRRRVTISPELVCGGTDKGCYLLRPERQFVNQIPIHKKALVLEATLTESCAPARFRWRAGSTFTLADAGAGCRTKAEPKVGGSDWHIY